MYALVSARDIAILKLSEPLVYNYFVSPICLPTNESVLPEQCTVAGWGALGPGKLYMYIY